MEEKKQAVCDAMMEVLKLTSLVEGAGNPLTELKYYKDAAGEYVRPIFKDGTGLNGYYDICVTMDSPTAMITDIVAQFVRRY